MTPIAVHRDGLVLSGGILVLIATRLWVWLELGIAPSQDHLLQHFQHVSPDDLSHHLLQSIFYLHSQPPLWNGLIGLHSKLCGAAIGCVVHSMHYQNLVFTAGIFICVHRTVSILTKSALFAACSATLFCLTPSVLFYETYLFYPHLTLLLSSIFTLGAAQWFIQRHVVGIAWCGLSLTLLGLTWTLFHPVLLLGLMGWLTSSAWDARARRTALSVALSAVLLVLLPSAKNAAVYGFFGNGSWTGFNLAQTAPKEIPGCRFSAFIAQFPPHTHLGTALNDPAIIPYSARCRDLALATILDDPIGYAKGRLWSGASSLSKWPSDYLYPPLNWDRLPGHATPKPIVTPEGDLQVRHLIDRIGILGVNLSAMTLLFLLSIFGGDPRRRNFFAYLFGYALLFLAATHLFNGVEQHRMRYTIQHLFWLPGTFAIAIAAPIAWSKRPRLPSPRLPASG
jgi:hypothetical protein